MWQQIGIALCLLLIMEGALPFLHPSRWRKVATAMTQIDDGALRVAGLASMVMGTLLLYVIN